MLRCNVRWQLRGRYCEPETKQSRPPPIDCFAAPAMARVAPSVRARLAREETPEDLLAERDRDDRDDDGSDPEHLQRAVAAVGGYSEKGLDKVHGRTPFLGVMIPAGCRAIKLRYVR